MKSRAPQLHLEYRFYKSLGTTGKPGDPHAIPAGVCVGSHDNVETVLEDCIISTTGDYCSEVYILIVSWMELTLISRTVCLPAPEWLVQ